MAKRKRSLNTTITRPTWVYTATGLGLLIAILGGAIFLFGANEPQVAQAPPTSTRSPLPTATVASQSLPALTPTSRPTATPTSVSPAAKTEITPTVEASNAPTVAALETKSVPIYTYKIINSYPHDRIAFTQGLIFEDDIFYEGTGLRGQSSLRKVNLETGDVIQIYTLPPQFFGEGITIFEDKLYQLTWQSQVGFVYNKDTFELLQEFTYPTEGWGLTHDGEKLIMSDGTATLYFRDPQTLEEIGRLDVRDHNGPVKLLNELEYIQGEIYANVWRTNQIARISPKTGQVTGWIQLDGLLGPEDLTQRVDVLNGIAYDAGQDRLFVTGKWWPKLFEIELVEIDE